MLDLTICSARALQQSDFADQIAPPDSWQQQQQWQLMVAVLTRVLSLSLSHQQQSQFRQFLHACPFATQRKTGRQSESERERAKERERATGSAHRFGPVTELHSARPLLPPESGNGNVPRAPR